MSLPSGSLPTLRPQVNKHCNGSPPPGGDRDVCAAAVEAAYDKANMYCARTLSVQLLCKADCDEYIDNVEQNDCYVRNNCKEKLRDLNECVSTIVNTALGRLPSPKVEND